MNINQFLIIVMLFFSSAEFLQAKGKGSSARVRATAAGRAQSRRAAARRAAQEKANKAGTKAQRKTEKLKRHRNAILVKRAQDDAQWDERQPRYVRI